MTYKSIQDGDLVNTRHPLYQIVVHTILYGRLGIQLSGGVA